MAAPTLQDMAAQDAASLKEHSDAQTAEQAKQTFGSSGQPNGILSWMTQMPKRITSDMIDSAVRAADSMAHDGSWGEAAVRAGRDVATGVADAAASTGKAVADFSEALDTGRAEKDYAETGGKGMSQIEQQRALEAQDPAMAARDRAMGDDAETLDYGQNPIWNHARSAIMDFRDAVAVKDPNLVDGLTQSVAQLAIPFAGYSKALSGVHDAAIAAQGLEDISATQGFGSYLAKTAQKDLTGFATKVVAPGAVTDATALKPRAMRFADLIALGRHTEGKLGDVLHALAPDGSAQDAYIRYLTDRGDESEAEGRFKNVLDGFGVNLLATPLITAAGSVLKQGTAGLRYMIDNGVPSMDKMPLPPQAFQEGKIVFHGTPHDFNEFDNSAIGSGEGAQAYGHGLYFAEEPGVARSYTRAGGPFLEHNGERIHAEEWDDPAQPSKMAVKDLLLAGNDRGLSRDGAQIWAEQQVKTKPAEFGLKTRDQQMQALDLLRQTKLAKGNFMHVEIHDDKINQMLDHDKTMAEQPDVLDKIPPEDRGQLEAVLDDHGQSPDLEEYTGGQLRQIIERAISEDRLNFTPRDGRYDNLSKVASEYMADHGIPGIKYLDEKSRDRRVFVDGKPYSAQGPTEEQAINLVRQTGGVRKAVVKAERLGWNKPDAFYQDREKYEALKALEAKGAEFKADGTRNIVLFNARDAKVVEKH